MGQTLWLLGAIGLRVLYSKVYGLDFYDQYRPLTGVLIEYYGNPWEFPVWKGFVS